MKIRSKLLYIYFIFLVVYAGFTLLPKPTEAITRRFNLSITDYRFVELSIIVLVAIIWYVGFYGYDKLQRYNSLIKKEKDGVQVAKLSRGILVLVLWLPISLTYSSIVSYVATLHPSLLSAITITQNYLNLVLPLIAFCFIATGTRGLSELTKQRPTFRATNLLSVILIYAGLIDYHLVVSTPNRAAVYHLSVWLILTTLVAPYICMWYLGLFAAYEIFRYSRKISGILYRSCWKYLAAGLGWLIVVSMLFQGLTTISVRLDRLSVYWILLIVYLLLLILSVGFILIASGTRKLQRIEEV